VSWWDSTTWWASDDPEQREFARSFLGLDEENHPESLTVGEKTILLQANEDYLGSLTRSDFENHDRRMKKHSRVSENLYARYVLDYSDLAGDKEGAALAMQRLASASGLSHDQLLMLAEEKPDEVLREIANEQTYIRAMQSGTGSYPTRGDWPDDDDDGRTAGVGDSGRGAGAGAIAMPEEDDKLGSMADDIRAFQRKHGFHR
jgi:hypothetical protein